MGSMRTLIRPQDHASLQLNLKLERRRREVGGLTINYKANIFSSNSISYIESFFQIQGKSVNFLGQGKTKKKNHSGGDS